MSDWNSTQTLDKYVHDYMVKRRMTKTAEIFAKEACVDSSKVAIDDSPDGFLSEWWSLFWDVFKFQNRQGKNDQEGIPTVPDPLQSLMQPANLVMNQESFSAMQPSNSILNPAMKQQSCSIAMNQRVQVMGGMPNASPSSAPLRIPPNPISISMNHQQTLGMMQPLISPTPLMLDQQQAMGTRTAIPMMGVMQPPNSIISSAIHQQMLAQIPQGMQEEPSILLAKMYEQDCLRRSARDFAVNKMNPMLESSSRSSNQPWQSADNNIQPWVGMEEDMCPMTYERSNAVVPTSQEASGAEIPDAGSSTHSTPPSPAPRIDRLSASLFPKT